MKLQKQGGNNPLTTPRLVVLSMSSVNTYLDYCPCLLKHVKPIWVLNRGRMLNLQERVRLMGFNLDDFKEPLPADMLGNSMAINTLERLLCRILPAVGLTGPLPDRWADGRAQIELAATVQRFKHSCYMFSFIMRLLRCRLLGSRESCLGDVFHIGVLTT